MALEVEDDVFFADLSRQIALLIMDDEEEFPIQSPSLLPVQELPYVPQMMMMTMMTPPQCYGHEASSHRRESKGTGVFIPRSAAPSRRKSKSRRPPSSAVLDGHSKSSVVAAGGAAAAHDHHAADGPTKQRRPGHVLKRHI